MKLKKYSQKFFLFLIGCIYSVSLMAANSNNLTQKMDQLLKPLDKTISLGIMVKNAKTGQLIYSKNIDRYFLPASNLKMLTALAALYYLGPEFTYQTELFADIKKLQDDTLHDTVYLKFSGDPTLTFEKINHLMKRLSLAGVRKIENGVVVDDRLFDYIAMSPGTVWDDQNDCYGAPLSALIIDRNCVIAKLKPASGDNQLAQMELPQYPQFIKFENEVLTDHETEKKCEVDVKPKDTSTYTISGCIKHDVSEQKIEMAVHNPQAYFKQILSYLLNKYHIENPMGVKFQKMEALPQKPLAIEYSVPLKNIVATLLKESDNMIANALFKTMGKRYTQQDVGTWENGKIALQAILSEMKLDFSKARIVDGSGLSRYNYLTPRQLMSLIKIAFSSKEFHSFYSALPISGVDGTLKDRMKGITFKKVHAKTGRMSGVSALSGYLKTRKNQALMFVILINGFVGDLKHYENFEDKICELLIESG